MKTETNNKTVNKLLYLISGLVMFAGCSANVDLSQTSQGKVLLSKALANSTTIGTNSGQAAASPTPPPAAPGGAANDTLLTQLSTNLNKLTSLAGQKGLATGANQNLVSQFLSQIQNQLSSVTNGSTGGETGNLASQLLGQISGNGTTPGAAATLAANSGLMSQLMNALHSGAADSSGNCDPLVLDLSGGGISFSDKNSNGILFDIANIGHPISTGWVAGSNVAFLVRDINHNGHIDNGSELFGNATKLKKGGTATSGFEALKDLDSNHDGVFDAKDAEWKNVKLWIDKDLNAATNQGELVSLESAQIESINLNYIQMQEKDAFGNETLQRSTFKFVGREEFGRIVDVWFSVEK